MNRNDDLIIGCITNYEWDQIKCWVNSLNRSGFKGKKAMILYNIKKDVAQRLVDNDFTVFAWDKDEEDNFRYKVPNFNICVERFAHLHYFLTKIESPIRYILTTDVRDVVFQKDPSDYMEWAFDTKRILASGENIKYKDEPWSNRNIKTAFGEYLYDLVKDKEINCAGVIAGERQHFIDLCLQIFLTCRGSAPHTPGGGGPDQAAYNIMLASKVWNDKTYYSDSDSDWACQAGTTEAAMYAGSGDLGLAYMSGVKGLVNKFLKGEAFLSADKQNIVNSNLDPYTIVHQYDRIKEWKEAIEKKYG